MAKPPDGVLPNMLLLPPNVKLGGAPLSLAGDEGAASWDDEAPKLKERGGAPLEGVAPSEPNSPKPPPKAGWDVLLLVLAPRIESPNRGGGVLLPASLMAALDTLMVQK